MVPAHRDRRGGDARNDSEPPTHHGPGASCGSSRKETDTRCEAPQDSSHGQRHRGFQRQHTSLGSPSESRATRTPPLRIGRGNAGIRIRGVRNSTEAVTARAPCLSAVGSASAIRWSGDGGRAAITWLPPKRARLARHPKSLSPNVISCGSVGTRRQGVWWSRVRISPARPRLTRFSSSLLGAVWVPPAGKVLRGMDHDCGRVCSRNSGGCSTAGVRGVRVQGRLGPLGPADEKSGPPPTATHPPGIHRLHSSPRARIPRAIPSRGVRAEVGTPART